MIGSIAGLSIDGKLNKIYDKLLEIEKKLEMENKK